MECQKTLTSLAPSTVFALDPASQVADSRIHSRGCSTSPFVFWEVTLELDDAHLLALIGHDLHAF